MLLRYTHYFIFVPSQGIRIVETAEQVLCVEEICGIKWVCHVQIGFVWQLIFFFLHWIMAVKTVWFFQIKYFLIWLWSTLSPLAGERKTTAAKKLVRSRFNIHSLHPGDVLTVLTPAHLFFLPPCSRVSCCSAEHVHGGDGVWISHLCSTPGAPHPVWLLHWADWDYTGVCSIHI